MDKKRKKIIIAATFFIIVLGCAVWPKLWWSMAKAFNPEVSIQPLNEKDIEGWKTYADPEFGFRFRYPQGYAVIDNREQPATSGAIKEILVQKSGTEANPELFFTIDLLEAESIGIGGIGFSLNKEPGSIGCTYADSACRIYLDQRKALVSVKISPYPWEMIDSVAKKSLATLSFFEPTRGFMENNDSTNK